MRYSGHHGRSKVGVGGTGAYPKGRADKFVVQHGGRKARAHGWDTRSLRTGWCKTKWPKTASSLYIHFVKRGTIQVRIHIMHGEWVSGHFLTQNKVDNKADTLQCHK